MSSPLSRGSNRPEDAVRTNSISGMHPMVGAPINRFQPAPFQLQSVRRVLSLLGAERAILYMNAHWPELRSGWLICERRVKEVPIHEVVRSALEDPALARSDASSACFGSELRGSDGMVHPLCGEGCLVLCIRDQSELAGLLLLERSHDAAAFTAAECSALEGVAVWLKLTTLAAIDATEREFELLAEHAAAPDQIRLLFDRVGQRVVFAPRQSSVSDPEIRESKSIREALASAVESWLAERDPERVGFPVALASIGFITGVWEVQGPYGEAWAAVSVLSHSGSGEAWSLLSNREQVVAKHLIEGRAAGDIALLEGVSEHTVRTYVRRIYQKLGVYSRSSLVLRLCT